MTQPRFYQISLFFPILLWVLALIVFPLLYREGDSAVVKHVFQGYRVFVPYLVFAAALWKFAGCRSYRMLMLMSFLVPIAWGVFFTIFYIIVSVIKDGRVSDEPHILCIMAFWAMFVAYLCELIPLAILVIFKNDFAPAEKEQARKLPSETIPQ